MKFRRPVHALFLLVVLFSSVTTSNALPISCRKVYCGAQCNIYGYNYCIWGYEDFYGCSQLTGGCASLRNASCCVDGAQF